MSYVQQRKHRASLGTEPSDGILLRQSLVGTCNLDRLSLVGNYEINLAVYSTEFAQQMSALFTGDTAERFELTMEQWRSRPWYTKVSERILAPLRFMM